MNIISERLAFDRSVRRLDQDGHMHVEIANISKAMVNPYYGREIPDSDQLGLDPNRIYYLYRDPVELQKAAPTFAGKPLLSRHRPQVASDHGHEITVGSVGQGVTFDPPYLKAPLTVWDADAIDGIVSREQRELSAGYRYRCVMEPGVVDGQKFDGRMTDIIGNHVALVSAGRNGPDVVVGDAALVDDGWRQVELALSTFLASFPGTR